MSASKRRKLSTWEPWGVCKTQQIYTLETLPPEVLETILTFLPLQIVATTFRLVSRHCQMVAHSLLNGAFFSAGQRLELSLSYTQQKITTVENPTDLLVFTKVFNILELVRMQYRLLRAVTWRYTHPPHPERFSRLSFYPGILLDQLNYIIYLARTHPSALIGPNGPENVVTDFFGLCKRFMNYFEKVSEKKFNRSPLVSGCKAVDLLDCLTEGRKLLSFRINPGRGVRGSIVCMHLQYTLRRAWFTCLQVPSSADENSWRDEQRFMYLRLRRLVASVNEHYYERLHYLRECSIQPTTLVLPKLPMPATYSGYGEYGGQFYYYGSMNKHAYATKWHRSAQSEVNEDYDGDDDNDDDADDVKSYPTCDLVIGVELRCSPELAPSTIRSLLKTDDVDSGAITSNPEIWMKMTVNCPASVANRLPGHFTWEVQSRRDKASS